MNKLAAFVSLLVAAAAALLAYAAANYSHGPDIAIPIAGIAFANIVLAIAALRQRCWSAWVLWVGVVLQIFVVSYLLREAFALGRLNGLDYVVRSDLLASAVLVAKILIESSLAWRIRKSV